MLVEVEVLVLVLEVVLTDVVVEEDVLVEVELEVDVDVEVTNHIQPGTETGDGRMRTGEHRGTVARRTGRARGGG